MSGEQEPTSIEDELREAAAEGQVEDRDDLLGGNTEKTDPATPAPEDTEINKAA